MTETSPLISTPFGFSSTAAEVVDGIDLTGRNAIVTGGASGSASRPPGRWPGPAPT